MASEAGDDSFPSLAALSALFPLTSPIPTLLSHPALLDPEHLTTEHDLARNPDQQQRWTQHIATLVEQVQASERTARGKATNEERATLGNKLSSPEGRLGLQKLTDVYERALAHQPRSFTLWKQYLAMRSSYVLGKATLPLKLGAPKKKRGEDGQGRSMVEWLEAGRGEIDELEEGERDVEGSWEGGLDGVVGWEEWRALAAVHERALMWLPSMPRLWLSYLSLFLHPSCPAPLSHTHARRTFDRALRSLAPSLHERIWRIYLKWAENIGGETAVRVWRRYLKVDPTPTHHYVTLLLSLSPPRPLEAAKLLLNLSRRAAAGTYKSPEGKSAYHLLGEWLEVCEKFPEETGVDEEETAKLRAQREKDDKEKAEKAAAEGDANKTAVVPATRGGTRPTPAGKPSTSASPYDASEDPLSPTLLDVEGIVRTEGLAVYKDQAGRLWTGLATYWIKRGEFALARQTFEEGISTVVTLRDFTQIFDAYAEFSESYISSLMEGLADADEEDVEDDEKEMDARMKDFEELMDRRPFLVNEVLLRRNPNDVQEWEKRVALFGNDDEKVAETYTTATKTIAPRKATAQFHTLWIHFAKFYEQGGVAGEAEADLRSARKIFEKATQVPFRKVDELAEIWCEWAEMEVRNENYDEAVKVMQRATTVPKKAGSISFHDEKLSAQARLFKSIKLWSFYVDLEESIGTVETTKSVYDKIFELKIATAQVVINYANFLEENEYWEESFKVYERGVDLFTYPIAFEIWNTYLSKFIKRYGGDKLERARDLFEQALEDCPPKFAKPLYLLYGHLEEEHGLAKRAMSVYDRATSAVENQDKMEMFTYYIAKATANFGLPATRPIYERAIESLPDKQTAEMCLRFAALERKLGEIDRARAIFAHASQFCDPRSNPDFWSTWNSFEIETGSEDTFREYLRIKRAVQAAFNTEASYLSAKLSQVQAGGSAAQEAVNGGAEVDPMSALDAATNSGALGGAFVAASKTSGVKGNVEEKEKAPEQGNADEIAMDDDDDDE
ncbi:spliceosome complex protein [Leucosporidium creatinivorum]|uniref:Pre-mRNA-splicing factor SYF1 n=1 Tax=Leucosporidium creatinivorum TaxID=106004 RepID=A0A1Y2FXA2_9BASI|nr:spliceosome complex protein [Leucosporidium creatinivorum]